METRNWEEILYSFRTTSNGSFCVIAPKTALHNVAHTYSDQANPLMGIQQRLARLWRLPPNSLFANRNTNISRLFRYQYTMRSVYVMPCLFMCKIDTMWSSLMTMANRVAIKVIYIYMSLGWNEWCKLGKRMQLGHGTIPRFLSESPKDLV